VKNKPIISKDAHNPQHEKGPDKDFWWWYGLKGGIDVIHEVRIDGKYIRTDALFIPLRKLRKYLQQLGEAERSK
jgi:hypothetical protein